MEIQLNLLWGQSAVMAFGMFTFLIKVCGFLLLCCHFPCSSIAIKDKHNVGVCLCFNHKTNENTLLFFTLTRIRDCAACNCTQKQPDSQSVFACRQQYSQHVVQDEPREAFSHMIAVVLEPEHLRWVFCVSAQDSSCKNSPQQMSLSNLGLNNTITLLCTPHDLITTVALRILITSFFSVLLQVKTKVWLKELLFFFFFF